MTSIKELDSKKLKEFDACAIITNHSNIDYKLIGDNCNLIIDTRDAMRDFNNKNVLRLGKG